jgi:bifunctional UDP-N-acetylglucosamine pyrophosphorylase/glucosamine-1-phosphate N-acetyltransferase
MPPSLRAVILAAGKGTRMKSALPKVLHDLCGRPMLSYVVQAARDVQATDILVVASPEVRERVEAMGLRLVVQEPQLGTGHAVQTALGAFAPDDTPLLIVSADMPLVPPELLAQVAKVRADSGAAVACVTAYLGPDSSFGRILRGPSGRVERIVEVRDATPEEARITEVNAGIYCFDQARLREAVAALSPDNAQRELYLTDCIAFFARRGEGVETVPAQREEDVVGVNDRIELARARQILQRRILERHMRDGVTVVDPAATYVDDTVSIGRDTTLLPQTHLKGATTVGPGCVIGPNTVAINATIGARVTVIESYVRDSTIGDEATVGPFAHLRGESVIERGAHIGNFVETKKTRVGAGAKASHLTYLGDADVGEGANIGAGTITCNYDGKKKNKTRIGKGAFIGSNSSLVAPVEIGDHALTGAGSVVLRDVPPGERVAGNPARTLPKKDPV